MSRFSFGDNPLSQALRACTISASAPAATTARARALHGRDAFGDQPWFRHQTGAKAAVLHPIRRATNIEIDFVVAKILADFRGRREIAGIRPGYNRPNTRSKNW